MRLRALAATAAVLLVPTSVAYAHTPLKSVRATFKAKMQTGIITITTSSGATVPLKSSGLLSSNKAVVRAVPKVALRSGTYNVSWRARAGDGHSEKGSWSFKVKL